MTPESTEVPKGLTRKAYFNQPVNLQKLIDASPKPIDPKRIVGTLLVMLSENSDLDSCSQVSLFKCALEGVALGLSPGKQHAYWYPVPFSNSKTGGKDAQFILGYKGAMRLVRSTGKIGIIRAEVVHKGDHFLRSEGLNPVLEHEPLSGNEAEITHAYCVIEHFDSRYPTGVQKQFCVMERHELDALERKSRSPAWKSEPGYSAMCKKSPILRMCRLLDLEGNIAEAIAIDDARSEGTMQGDDIIDVDATEVDNPTSLDELKKKLMDESNDPSAEEPDDTVCAGCSTTENVGPNGLCSTCQDAADHE